MGKQHHKNGGDKIKNAKERHFTEYAYLSRQQMAWEFPYDPQRSVGYDIFNHSTLRVREEVEVGRNPAQSQSKMMVTVKYIADSIKDIRRNKARKRMSKK